MSASLYLFDDRIAQGWEPFSLTRPAGELLLGCLLQRERAEHFWQRPCSGHLAGDSLVGFREAGAPPAIGRETIDPDSSRILLSSRVVPPFEPPPFPLGDEPAEPATLKVKGEAVGWVLPREAPTPEDAALLDPTRAEEFPASIELGGRMLVNVWNLVAENSDQLRADIPRLHPRSDAFLPPGVHHIGRGLVSIARGVELEPGITLDTREGPIRLEEGVIVRSMTRLEGPLFLGPDTQIFGGSIGHASIGPRCKIRGEVEASIILGFSNKAHDGYLGHGCLGRWVNLGALTTNSDLKNNYGPVRVRTSKGDTDTGLTKVGCFLGDHVKTGIGTLLNTGSVIGAGSNVFGGAMPPSYVPPFSWGAGDEFVEYRLDRFLEVAEVVMSRRDVEMTEEDREFLGRTWERARAERPGSAGKDET